MSRAPSNSIVPPPAGAWPADSHADAARNNRDTASFAFRTNRIRPPRRDVHLNCTYLSIAAASCRTGWRNVVQRGRRKSLMRMRTVALILVTFAVGAGVGIWTEGTPRHRVRSVSDAGQRLRGRARRDRQPGPDGPLRGRQGLAEGHQHAARQREVDLRRGTGRVRREPEPHLHALPRRAAEDGARRGTRCCRSSDPASASRSPGCGATRRRPRCPASAAPIRTPGNG